MFFGRRNYYLMISGVVVIFLGFLLMSLEKAAYGFGVLGLTAGPLVVLLGFIIEFFAIFPPSKSID